MRVGEVHLTTIEVVGDGWVLAVEDVGVGQVEQDQRNTGSGQVNARLKGIGKQAHRIG